MELIYTEILSLADGRSVPVEHTIPVPEGRVLAENQAHCGPAYFPIEGVTLPPGGIWHWEPKAAEESQRLRVLDPDEIKQRTARGRVRTKATYSRTDPVTGISDADYEHATGPVPQTAPEEEN